MDEEIIIAIVQIIVYVGIVFLLYRLMVQNLESAIKSKDAQIDLLNARIPKASELNAELELYKKSYENKIALINEEKENISKELEKSKKLTIEGIRTVMDIVRPRLEKLAEYESKEFAAQEAYRALLSRDHSLATFLEKQVKIKQSNLPGLADIINDQNKKE